MKAVFVLLYLILSCFNTIKKNESKFISYLKFKLSSVNLNSLSQSRLQYKEIEAFIIYFFPGDAYKLNRPVIAEMEEDEKVSPLVEPHGFQYLEQMMYEDSAGNAGLIRKEIAFMQSIFDRLPQQISHTVFPEREIFEAMQLQLIRQFMLGFTNFENIYSKNGVAESVAVLNSFPKVLSVLFPDVSGAEENAIHDFRQSVNAAANYLSGIRPGEHPDFFHFYSTHYKSVSEKLLACRNLLVEDNFYNTTAVNLQSGSIFGPNAFNSNFFLPPHKIPDHAKAAALGKLLFFDPALSSNGRRSCASCHRPGLAFTDGLQKSKTIDGKETLPRNAPTLINAVLQRRLFADGRAFSFEAQAGEVMSNPLELHADFNILPSLLDDAPEYVMMFKEAFADTPDTVISKKSILTAIGEYERTLVGLNSRFDRAICGQRENLSADERAGFNLFLGKGNCGSCHFPPLFNGTFPPDYYDTEWEIIGVPADKSMKAIDADSGRAGFIPAEVFLHAFKTPTVRNAALTAPYMHNGVFGTLEEVMDFYDAGGGEGLGYEVPGQTLLPDSLHLTQKEKNQIIAFIQSLTDTTGMTSMPVQLPQFNSNSTLNKRIPGSEN